MVNKNYRRGRDKEYRVKKKLAERGYITLRSAGSHSPIDVMGFDTMNRIIYLIQCKPKSMSEKAKQRIVEENQALNGYYQVKFRVV